jgi:hypothetical protein
MERGSTVLQTCKHAQQVMASGLRVEVMKKTDTDQHRLGGGETSLTCLLESVEAAATLHDTWINFPLSPIPSLKKGHLRT